MVKIYRLKQDETVKAVRKGSVTISIVGLGYVGLPLSALFAVEGAKVIGCDIDPKIVKLLNEGKSHIVEHDVASLLNEGAEMINHTCPNCGVRLLKYKDETFCPSCGRLAVVSSYGARLLETAARAHSELIGRRTTLDSLVQRAVEAGRLHATTDTTGAVRESDVTLITVGTPLSERNEPNTAAIIGAGRAIGKGLTKDSLVILKSTVSPGTTEGIVKPILEEESGLKAGSDFGLAHMPERIKEGHALLEFRTIPRIVGGVNRRSGEAAAALFGVFPAPVHVFDSPRVTETSKLFENIYRDVNIALVNELAQVCERIHVDVMKAINAANTDPKTHLLTPGPGVGGYCLPKDTYYLAHPSQRASFKPKMILLAREINDGMANHIIDLVKECFAEMDKEIRGSKVAILGLAFKGNSGDLRNTPAYPILRGLIELGAEIVAQDPFVDFDELRQRISGLALTRDVKEAVGNADCAVLLTDHLEYRQIRAADLAKLMKRPSAFVDTRHIMEKENVTTAGIVYRGIGHGE